MSTTHVTGLRHTGFGRWVLGDFEIRQVNPQWFQVSQLGRDLGSFATLSEAKQFVESKTP